MTLDRRPAVAHVRRAEPRGAATHGEAVHGETGTASIEPGGDEILATQLEWVLGIALVWALVGVLAALVLRRRGHEFVPAAVIGVAFGPLLIPLARRDLRTYVPGELAIVVAPSTAGTGQIDVLVSVKMFDHPGGVGAAVDECVGPRCGRLTIAGAIDYQSAETGTLSRAARRVAHRLELASVTIAADHPSGQVLVGGPSPEALIRYARRHHYELVVLAPHEPVPELMPDGPVVVRASSTPN